MSSNRAKIVHWAKCVVTLTAQHGSCAPELPASKPPVVKSATSAETSGSA